MRESLIFVKGRHVVIVIQQKHYFCMSDGKEIKAAKEREAERERE